MNIKNFFHKLLEVGKKSEYNFEERVDEVESYFSPPLPSTFTHKEECNKCGGFFNATKLKLVTEISVVGREGEAYACFNDIKKYCDRCVPAATVILTLMDDKGKNIVQDSRYFNFNKYEITETFSNGDAVVSLTLEEAEVVYCKVCGETNPAVTCSSCKKKEKKNG